MRFSALIEQPVELSTIIHLIVSAARMFAFHISLSLTSRIFLSFRGWLVCAGAPRARFSGVKRKRRKKLEGILVKMSENDSYSGRGRRCELSKCGRTRNSKKIRNDCGVHSRSTVAFFEGNTMQRGGNFALHSQLREICVYRRRYIYNSSSVLKFL